MFGLIVIGGDCLASAMFAETYTAGAVVDVQYCPSRKRAAGRVSVGNARRQLDCDSDANPSAASSSATTAKCTEIEQNNLTSKSVVEQSNTALT